MAVYFITGKLGAGKSLVAVKRIKDYLREGRRVATNLDLTLENFWGPHCRNQSVIRILDKPRLQDMQAIGVGYEGEDVKENRYGLVVLDELGSWLNSRS